MDTTLKWRRWLGAPPRIRRPLGPPSTRTPPPPCLRPGRALPPRHGPRPGCPPAPAATVIIQGPRFQDPGPQGWWRLHEAARLALAGPRRGGPECVDGPVSLPVLLDGRHGPEAPRGVLSVSPHAAARPRHGGPVPLGPVRAGLPGAAAQQPRRMPDGRRRGDRGGHADCLPGDEAAGLARVPAGPDELDPQPALPAAHRRGHPIFRHRAEAGTV